MVSEPTSQHANDVGCCTSPLDVSVCRTPSMEHLRRHAFAALRFGTPASLSDLATAIAEDISVARTFLAELVTAGVAVVEGDLDADPRVVGAEGLTVRPTAHRLELSGRPLYTWCAVDTVGIPAALSVDATAKTSCPVCGSAIELHLPKGRPPSSPVVGWWPTGAIGPVNEAFCPTALFFCHRDHLDTWRRTRPAATGEAVTLAAMAERGRQVWALFADPNAHGGTA